MMFLLGNHYWKAPIDESPLQASPLAVVRNITLPVRFSFRPDRGRISF
jgi:hypothetical protein